MLIPLIGRVIGGGGLSSILKIAMGSGLLALWSAPTAVDNSCIVFLPGFEVLAYTMPIITIILQAIMASDQRQFISPIITKTHPGNYGHTSTRIGQEKFSSGVFSFITIFVVAGVSGGVLVLDRSTHDQHSHSDGSLRGREQSNTRGGSREPENTENFGDEGLNPSNDPDLEDAVLNEDDALNFSADDSLELEGSSPPPPPPPPPSSAAAGLDDGNSGRNNNLFQDMLMVSLVLAFLVAAKKASNILHTRNYFIDYLANIISPTKTPADVLPSALTQERESTRTPDHSMVRGYKTLHETCEARVYPQLAPKSTVHFETTLQCAASGVEGNFIEAPKGAPAPLSCPNIILLYDPIAACSPTATSDPGRAIFTMPVPSWTLESATDSSTYGSAAEPTALQFLLGSVALVLLQITLTARGFIKRIIFRVCVYFLRILFSIAERCAENHEAIPPRPYYLADPAVQQLQHSSSSINGGAESTAASQLKLTSHDTTSIPAESAKKKIVTTSAVNSTHSIGNDTTSLHINDPDISEAAEEMVEELAPESPAELVDWCIQVEDDESVHQESESIDTDGIRLQATTSPTADQTVEKSIADCEFAGVEDIALDVVIPSSPNLANSDVEHKFNSSIDGSEECEAAPQFSDAIYIPLASVMTHAVPACDADSTHSISNGTTLVHIDDFANTSAVVEERMEEATDDSPAEPVDCRILVSGEESAYHDQESESVNDMDASLQPTPSPAADQAVEAGPELEANSELAAIEDIALGMNTLVVSRDTFQHISMDDGTKLLDINKSERDAVLEGTCATPDVKESSSDDIQLDINFPVETQSSIALEDDDGHPMVTLCLSPTTHVLCGGEQSQDIHIYIPEERMHASLSDESIEAFLEITTVDADTVPIDTDDGADLNSDSDSDYSDPQHREISESGNNEDTPRSITDESLLEQVGSEVDTDGSLVEVEAGENIPETPGNTSLQSSFWAAPEEEENLIQRTRIEDRKRAIWQASVRSTTHHLTAGRRAASMGNTPAAGRPHGAERARARIEDNRGAGRGHRSGVGGSRGSGGNSRGTGNSHGTGNSRGAGNSRGSSSASRGGHGYGTSHHRHQPYASAAVRGGRSDRGHPPSTAQLPRVVLLADDPSAAEPHRQRGGHRNKRSREERIAARENLGNQ